MDSKADRERDKKKERKREIDRQVDGKTNRQRFGLREKQTDGQVDILNGWRRTDRQTVRERE